MSGSVALVREGSPSRACAALDAIATYRNAAALRERVLEAVEERDEARVGACAHGAEDRHLIT